MGSCKTMYARAVPERAGRGPGETRQGCPFAGSSSCETRRTPTATRCDGDDSVRRPAPGPSACVDGLQGLEHTRGGAQACVRPSSFSCKV